MQIIPVKTNAMGAFMTFFKKIRGMLHQCTPAGQRDVRECRRLSYEAKSYMVMIDRTFEQYSNLFRVEPTNPALRSLADRHRALGAKHKELTEQWNVVAARLGIDPV